ncbi:ATP-binding cassette domain-containing protein [Pseudomonas sp. GOM6]|uniref:metal ABC transporter ATP-binding protein n=1 Tax=Pseudomonas sp. GOM6 TaxID=3036944 RepID=UPI0024094FB2|nr:ATP-binding cassette domain-containing protein [Pseudomonas sp. GOM6]MDG1583164.1 ATP-binding cassette domain-containing protein [Pseudomonas sp. GOM6]
MIDCQGLQWGAPGRPLTPPLDLHLAAGSLTGIIGLNGCGKSSLLKVIAGLQAPLAGLVRVDAPRQGGIGFLQQQQAFDRQFPINLRELVGTGLWHSTGNHRQRQERLDQALRRWQLCALQRLPLEALSGGQLQRALLARLDLTDAAVLLLDEPEAALDQASQALFWERARQWQSEGRTLLVVSHAIGHLSSRLDNALLVSPQGCILAPLAQLMGKSLERVA